MTVDAMADDERNTAYRSSPPSNWNHFPIHPHSHHGTPAQEYQGFSFASPQLPMEPSAFASGVQQRSMHHHLQPLVMPQWPSMLSSQAHAPYQSMYQQPMQTMHPVSTGPLMTPLSATSTKSTSTPRKTLTDLDRKRMCQYAEEHPNSKQTEIGAIFGVERSTVSKVLRQKEKFLFQDDGSRSPVKRAKGRSPDIERALAVWAKNQEKKGNPLSDDLIRAQARAFAATTSSPDHLVSLSSSWIGKFKLKNNLLGARSRKTSLVPDDPDHPAAASSSSHTPGDLSPTSPSAPGSPSPIDLQSAQSYESQKRGSPDDYFDFASNRNGPHHAQSTTSLHSAYTENGPSSFSPGPLSPTTSPFFTPDSGTAPSPFVPPSLQARPILVGPSSAANSHRPRSQTFPCLEPAYVSSSGDATTPKYSTSSDLNASTQGPLDALTSLDEAMSMHDSESRPPTVTPLDTMRPPPLPAHAARRESGLAPGLAQGITPEEARQALRVVLRFIEQHGVVDYHETLTMGTLMEKLKLQQPPARAHS